MQESLYNRIAFRRLHADNLQPSTHFVIEYRSFLNTDPPALIEIWQKQKPFRCLSQMLSRKLLDQMVLGKPYFDPQGLILAINKDDQPLGFVHVGFGPNANKDCIDCNVGIVAQLRFVDCPEKAQVANGLLQKAMEYLKARGATVCHAGGKFPCSPFYTGLYGGSRIPGVPAEDVEVAHAFREFGFQTGQRILVMQRNLQGFRAPASRSQMAVRRQFQVAAIVDPLLPNWWECCTFGWAELFGFRIIRRSDQYVAGRVLFWEIQPLSNQWGASTMGLVDLAIEDDNRRQGLATFLVGESLRHLASQGVASVEIQLRESDEPTIGVVRRMGFEQISDGVEMEISLE